MALTEAFPLPSIAGHGHGMVAEVLVEDDDEEADSSEDESSSFEESDNEGGADARGSASSRLLPTRIRSQDPRALEAVIEGALGPNPTVSRTPTVKAVAPPAPPTRVHFPEPGALATNARTTRPGVTRTRLVHV